MAKSLKKYKDISIKRGNFKIVCKNKKWKFKDFKEIASGEFCGQDKKYYYIHKSDYIDPLEKYIKMIEKLKAAFKMNVCEIKKLRTIEVRFYAINMGVKMEDLSIAIEKVCF